MFYKGQLLTYKVIRDDAWVGAIFQVDELTTPTLIRCTILHYSDSYHIGKQCLIPTRILKPYLTIKEL